MEITRKVLRFDILNLNNRIYLKEMMIPLIETFNKEALDVPKYGQIGYPDNFDICIGNASHFIKRIYIEGDYLMADIKILSSKNGDILKNILKEVVFRPRSAGVTDSNNEVRLKKIFTFDAICESIDSFKNLM